MAFRSSILADSRNPNGGRLTTMELTYPRCIHSEFMTHRAFSRNSASSRAIPVKKMLQDIERDPFIPLVWGTNQKGMQAGAEHDNPQVCEFNWISAMRKSVAQAWVLHDLGLHKQIVNRIVEPWMWITVIATGNEMAFENFFKLRCHPDAEPHIQAIAYMARDLYDKGTPDQLEWGGLHLPLFGFDQDSEITSPIIKKKLATARCARVSYRTHQGERDVSADLNLWTRLRGNGHWSPFEHVATAMTDGKGGNFGPGWMQYRKEFTDEVCLKAPR